MGDVTLESARQEALDLETAKRVGDQLNTLYPGHLWAVEVKGPLITIRDLYLAGNWGFIINQRGFASASEMERKIMLSGGELLERYRQRRGALDLAAVAALPMDHAGRHRPDM